MPKLPIQVDGKLVFPVAGMHVPAKLAPRITSAFRAQYPSITEGLEDDQAVRAVLKFLVTDILARHEAAEALSPVEDEVRSTRQRFAEAAEKARQRALKDAATITEAPEEPNVPPTDAGVA